MSAHEHGSARAGHDHAGAQHERDSEPAGHNHADHGHGHVHRGGVVGFAASLVRPHSHDAADSIDSALEASAAGIRALKISLVVLLATAIAQLVVVLYTGSVALLADTVHNFSDALTAIPLWAAFILGRRKATRAFTYGYGRAEDLAGAFIVAMIALSAVLAGYQSISRLIDPQPIEHVGVVLAAGLVGFAGNEAVAIYRIRVGRAIGSGALVADGLHARTDGFTSLAVVVGALGVMAGFPLADPIVGLAITIAILVVLRTAALDIGRRLMDGVDPTLVERAETALAAVPGVVGIEALRLRWVGHQMRAEADLAVDPALSVVQGHQIAVAAHHQLLHQVPRLVEATVHISPAGAHGEDDHQVLAHHR